MTEKEQIRFGLCLPGDDKKLFSDAVFDAFEEQERMRRKERELMMTEIKRLRTENDSYKQAYFDQMYNNREIEKCWNVLGGYNRQHLELHEAIREYMRNREWEYTPKQGSSN